MSISNLSNAFVQVNRQSIGSLHEYGILEKSVEEVLMGLMSIAVLESSTIVGVLFYFTLLVGATVLLITTYLQQSGHQKAAFLIGHGLMVTWSISRLMVSVNFLKTISDQILLSIEGLLVLALVFYAIALRYQWMDRHHQVGIIYGGQGKLIEHIFSHLSDLVLVMDYRGVIIHANRIDLINELCPGCHQFMDLIGYLGTDVVRDHIKGLRSAVQFPFPPLDVQLNDYARGKHYQLRTIPVAVNGKPVGFSAILSEITDYVNLVDQISESNRQLKEANNKLEQSVHIEAKLAEEKVRMTLLKEIQRSLIGDIELAISETKSRIHSLETNPHSFLPKEVLESLAAQIRGAYKLVREAVYKMH